jgi:putative DNA primase/helicase
VGLAYSIEFALAASRLLNLAFWATVDAGNAADVPMQPGIEALTIFADHDELGMESARACAGLWRAAARETRVWQSRVPGEDAADVTRRTRSLVSHIRRASAGG